MGDHDDRELVKVVFRVEDGEGVHVETPWARVVGPNEYELDNLPWYAYGISAGDVFEATPEKDDPRPHLRRVLRKSGNRTVRLILAARPEESEESAAVLKNLGDLGCGYEGANGRYFAVNIPPTADFEAVTCYLTAAQMRWEHADPEWKDLYPSARPSI